MIVGEKIILNNAQLVDSLLVLVSVADLFMLHEAIASVSIIIHKIADVIVSAPRIKCQKPIAWNSKQDTMWL